MNTDKPVDKTDIKAFTERIRYCFGIDENLKISTT